MGEEVRGRKSKKGREGEGMEGRERREEKRETETEMMGEKKREREEFCIYNIVG